MRWQCVISIEEETADLLREKAGNFGERECGITKSGGGMDETKKRFENVDEEAAGRERVASVSECAKK